jgi:hypothetical protein
MSTNSGASSFEQRLGEAYRARVRERGARDHPDEAVWEALATGTLDPAARARLADHVVVCAPCLGLLEAVRTLMEQAPAAGVRAAAVARPIPGQPWWRRHAPLLALAASLLLVVAAAAAYLAGRRDGPARVTSDAGTPEHVPRAEPPRPVTPAFRLAMVKPDVRLPADLIVTSRGAAGAETRRFLAQFGEAIGPYREGRFDEAATRLARLADARGDVADVWFYLGVSHLFAGRAADALKAFEQPGVAAAAGDDLPWQRAVALERLGRAQDSDAVLRALCTRAGPYRDRACAALSEGAVPSPPTR